MTSDYRYGGARALVSLHDRHLREFLRTWRRADALDLSLPATDDPAYVSRETLLAHVLGCAARYLAWICAQVDFECPPLEQRPPSEGFRERADAYLEEVLAAWQGPLRKLTEEQADGETYLSTWGVPYSIDAMLEHAVMHPIRHAEQLERLIERAQSRSRDTH